jgi:hypothetical protein
MTALKVLFIDDVLESVQTAYDLAEANGYICESRTFEEAKDEIESMAFHIIVLDVLKDDQGLNPEPGRLTYKFIWQIWFRPVVVYSANPAALGFEPHPFIRDIKKGAGSEHEVLAALNELRAHAEAITEAEKHVREQFATSLRDVAPHAFEALADPADAERRKDLIIRTARRRLAAKMDEYSEAKPALASWEQYLCPPVSESPLVGDIIREKEQANDDPSAYRMILTPSCDLVGTRKHASHVLVAGCCSVYDGLKLINKEGMKNQDLLERLPVDVLSQGFFKEVLPCPALVGQIPSMCVNLKSIELVPYDQLGVKYDIIASVDSPFREMVSWAYMQVGCRLGLPERDLDSWASEIAEERDKNKEKK